ncbi:hypothetical protein TI03_06570 [Achromatium sp. WMS1]|nr:hypothetical protein TI03_06570 [Achromatium sp. WMS1]
MIAYLQPQDLLLPLQELMLLLEFPILEAPTGANGWFLNQERTFDLNIRTKQVTIANAKQPLKPEDSKYIDSALFVSARAISRWFPLDLVINLRTQTLEIHPREPIPLESRSMRAQQGFGSIRTFRSTLPRHYAPYAGIALPATDLNLSIGISERGQENYTASGTLRAFGDFAFMNGKLFISADKNDITNAYMSLGRSDPDGTLLGPLGATAWEIGDVTATSVPLVSSSGNKRS